MTFIVTLSTLALLADEKSCEAARSWHALNRVGTHTGENASTCTAATSRAPIHHVDRSTLEVEAIAKGLPYVGEKQVLFGPLSGCSSVLFTVA